MVPSWFGKALTVVVSPLQLIDITGKNQDECVIALHDCNGDVNRAINVLLEGNPDTVGLGPVNLVRFGSVWLPVWSRAEPYSNVQINQNDSRGAWEARLSPGF